MLRAELRHIFRTGIPMRTSNLVHRSRTKTRITDKRHDLQGQRSRSQGRVVRLPGVGPYVENETSQDHQNLYKLPTP